MSNLRCLSGPPICLRDLMLATPGKLFSKAGWLYELKDDDGFPRLVSKRDSPGRTTRWLKINTDVGAERE